MKILTITTATIAAQLEELMPFLDMRQEALDSRGKCELELHKFDDDTVVLYSPDRAFAYVNQDSNGVRNSLFLSDLDGVKSAEHAARIYATGDVNVD